MKTKFFLIVIIVIFCSCENPVKRVYYDTGELFYEKITMPNSNDSLFYIKEYYKNGSLKEEGLSRNDSILEGHWKMYYADGVLRWEGEFKNSVIQHEFYSRNWTWSKVDDYFKGIEVEGHPNKLIVGRIYNFRIEMPKIHPKFRLVLDSNYNSMINPENKDVYPYRMCPKKSGKYFFNIVFMDKNGHFTKGNPTIHPGFEIVDP